MALCGHLMTVSDVFAPLHVRAVSRTFRVLNDSRVHALHNGDGRVGSTQVNTDDRALHLLIAALSVLRIPSAE